ncbi:non-ribosomal peptide synthetase, partial [Streptomyces sp. CB01881]|uniref:non-ribosomal peptide synthetase n=1 Tax=Streptomyces sp. CB01881 TaxID=2078691 RepID=UPI000CDC11DF
ELFAEQSSRTPGAVALCDDERELTYDQLNTEANRLAHHLRGLGVGPEVRVALCLERSIDLIVAILAVFKAGGAYVPIDMALSGERIAYMLGDAQVSVVVTTTPFTDRLPAPTAPVVRLDEERERISALPAGDPPAPAGPRNLAYVIYTSGSTGAPKGAMVEQRGMVNHLYAKIIDLGLTGRDTVAATASPCFDISVWQFFAALLTGGTVRVYTDAVAHDPVQLLARSDGDRLTVLEIVPSLLRALLDELARLGSARPGLAALRWLVLTGEALPPELCRDWLRHYPALPQLNAYGPTECSDDVTHHAIHTSPGTDDSRTPIGKAVANTRLYVLDDALQPVPVGAAGELLVGGVGVGRGYHGRPALTAERFVPDPFSTEAGARLYRTGDLARQLADGTLDYLGRTDHQIKLRGFRIEAGEIEATLKTHPTVHTAVVLLREDTPGDQRLVAYVVPPVPAEGDPVAEADPAELRRYCAARLPHYMTPAAVMPLAELPLTPNGKIDRKALPAPGPNLLAADQQGEAPLPGVETELAALWADVLGVEKVGRYSDFFALGGHSLLAMQVIARLPGLFQVEVPLRTLFEAPTPAAFAEQTVKALATARPGPELRPAPRDQDLPLSFAQQRLWFLDQLQPGTSIYNLPLAVRVEGPLDTTALATGLREVTRRHESLRTTFTSQDGEPRQVIAPEPDMPLPVIDLGALPADHQLTTARHLAEQEAQQPFDLQHGP